MFYVLHTRVTYLLTSSSYNVILVISMRTGGSITSRSYVNANTVVSMSYILRVTL
jgi:hypothetical protein